MNKQQEVMKAQACVLRVNIHCDGCRRKVKKLLQNTEGVYTVAIDAEQGKVTVTGAVDPDMLIKKLEKSGKHAELWGGGAATKNTVPFNFNNLNTQFKNLGLENMKFGKPDNKKPSQNVGKDQTKQHQQHLKQKQQQLVKEIAKDMKQSKEQKTVKFNLPKENEFEDSGDDLYDESGDDDDDDGSDGFGDMYGEGYGNGHQKAVKVSMKGGSEDQKGSKGANNDKKGAKKGGIFDIPSFMKGLGLKGGDSKKKGGKNGDGKDKKGGKNGDKDGKKKTNDGGGKNKGEGNNGSGGGNNKGSSNGGAKKGGAKNGNDHHDGFHLQPNSKAQLGFDEINRIANIKGNGNGGGYMGQMGNFPMGQMGNFPMGQMGNFPMGQMGNVPAVQGLPAMNGGGYYQNPNQQQYPGMNMNSHMMMNQQQHHHQSYGHGTDMYAMMYGRPNQPVGYVPPMPPPVSDPYVHMFSDENASGCSVM